jgi:hypothetical protein
MIADSGIRSDCQPCHNHPIEYSCMKSLHPITANYSIYLMDIAGDRVWLIHQIRWSYHRFYTNRLTLNILYNHTKKKSVKVYHHSTLFLIFEFCAFR